jgi:hypothetical protein
VNNTLLYLVFWVRQLTFIGYELGGLGLRFEYRAAVADNFERVTPGRWTLHDLFATAKQSFQ